MRTAYLWSFISEEAEPGVLSTRRRAWRSTLIHQRVFCARGRGNVSALRSQVWGARREGGATRNRTWGGLTRRKAKPST